MTAFTILHPAEQARLNALADAIEAEARRRVLTGWAETRAEERVRDQRQIECVRVKWTERDDADPDNACPALGMVGTCDGRRGC